MLSSISATTHGNVLAVSMPPIILLVEIPFGCVELEVCLCFVLNIGKKWNVVLEFGADGKEFSLEPMFGYAELAIPHASTTEM